MEKSPSVDLVFVLFSSVALIPIGIIFYYLERSTQAGFTIWLSLLILIACAKQQYDSRKRFAIFLGVTILAVVHIMLFYAFPWSTKWRLLFLPGPFILIDGIIDIWILDKFGRLARIG